LGGDIIGSIISALKTKVLWERAREAPP